jgi:hypothetical protein
VNRGRVIFSQPPLTKFLINLAAWTMHKRFLIPVLVAVAFLVSEGGGFLNAFLCPHFRLGLASCERQVKELTASHGHMEHKQTKSMNAESTPIKKSDRNAVGQPADPCGHCAIHSGATTDPSSLRENQAAKRSSHLNLSPTVSEVDSAPSSFLTTPSARAHGPPRELIPRHILISIFRI